MISKVDNFSSQEYHRAIRMAGREPNFGAYKEELKQPFLDAFSRIGTIVGAARAVGIARETIALWKRNDTGFREQFLERERELTERLESTIIDKALAGDLGSCIFLLKARAPQKYMERYQHQLDTEQFEKLISVFTGVVKRVVPQELWPRISAELENAASLLEQNKQNAHLQ